MNPPESVAFPLPTLNPEPAVPRSAPARKLPKDQWEVHREIIEEMYPMKGITLKDIIKYLAERGFTVTYANSTFAQYPKLTVYSGKDS